MKVKEQLKQYDRIDLVYICAYIGGTLNLVDAYKLKLNGIDLDYEVLEIENAETNDINLPMKIGEQDLVISLFDYIDMLKRLDEKETGIAMKDDINEAVIDLALAGYCIKNHAMLIDHNYRNLRGYVTSMLEEEMLKHGNFADDEEKMRDFRELTKAQFLESYSYLTEEEYDNTMKIEMGSCYDEIGRCIDHLDKLHHCLFSYDMNEKDEDRCDGFECCIEDLEHGMCQLLYGEE